MLQFEKVVWYSRNFAFCLQLLFLKLQKGKII